VVVSHAKLFFVWPDPSPASVRLLMSIIEGGTVPFLFIAGFLFQHLSRRFDYWRYLRTKANFVLLPYLLWSLPVLIHSYIHGYGVYLGRDGWSRWRVFGMAAHGLVTGRHMFIPFWFIPTILIIYLLAPVFLAIDRRPKLYWSLPALLLAGSLMHLSTLYLNVWQDTANMIPVYLLGMAVSRFREPVLAAIGKYWHLLLIGAIALIVEDVLSGQGGRVQSALPFSTEHGMIDFTYLQKILLSLWVLQLLARREASAPTSTSFWRRAADRLADLSFGMFFLHMYVKGYLLDPLARRFYHLPLTDWLQFLAVSAVLFLVTLLVVSLAKWAAGKYSRYLMGC
jgi:surface polysaccharide O-acyltransferase-like enzyme